MELLIEKHQTFKGFSYLMKTSDLKEALNSIKFDGYVHLTYYTPQLNNISHYILVEAEYWLPNSNVNYERFYIQTGVSESQKRKELETITKEIVIPRLVKWMTDVQSLPDNSTSKENRRFSAIFKNNELIISE